MLNLNDIDHRPWELPAQRWTLAMQWHDLLFMHWPVPVAMLRDHIPPMLSIDTFDGTAWIGVVPFRMAAVHPRLLPSLPWLSAFPELNVRTYVTIGGKPGVWFFSLDAANPVAVHIARLTFHLPYYYALMALERVGTSVYYTSTRIHRRASKALFCGSFRPTGEPALAHPGTLDHWLTERYCLYASDQQGCMYRGDIHHQPWPLQPAEAEIVTNTMTEQMGLKLPNCAPLLHFVRRLDVIAWNLTCVAMDS